jgi:hypothetical protein
MKNINASSVVLENSQRKILPGNLGFIYIVICVPSLVEIAPGVPELSWNIHIYIHFYIL